jgi:hypothetical protein
MRSGRNRKTTFILLSPLLALLTAITQNPAGLAQLPAPNVRIVVPFVIPEGLQTIAKEVNACSNYGLSNKLEDKALCQDLLTAVSVMAAERARKQGREPTPQDYRLMLYFTCQPGDPPKSASFQEEMKRIRRRLAEGAYLSSTKREEIAHRLKLPLLTWSAPDVRSALSKPDFGISFFLDASGLRD